MMRRKGKELKALARQALLGNYGTTTGAILLYYLSFFVLVIPLIILILLLSDGKTEPGAALFAGMGIWYAGVILLALVFSAGLIRICYQICIGQRTGVSDLFYGFSHHPFRVIGLSLLISLISIAVSLPGVLLMIASIFWEGSRAVSILLYLIGFLLLLIVMMTVTIQYSFALFVLVENPERRAMECLRISQDLAAGNRMRIIKLGISFAGVYMLGYLSLGIGYLWITPYIICSMIHLYLSIKEEKYPVPAVTTEDYLY